MSAPLVVSRLAARAFLRRALGLDAPHPDVASALAHHGYIQIDPINVCGRMHDLILRNRVAGYREGDLHRFLHAAPRGGFEHYLPHAGVLVAFPLDAWPWLAPAIRARRLRRDDHRRLPVPQAEKLAAHILAELAARGPLTSDDIEHDGRSLTAWGTRGRLVKNVLEILFAHGRVLITARRNFRRVYDLPERVLPSALLDAPGPDASAIARWSILLPLRQRRLVTLKRADAALVADAVQQVRIEGCPPLYCLREDADALAASRGEPVANPGSSIENSLRLLAPLDPLIYDRRVTSALWDFDYTWEVYTPLAKRTRGYYALPVLAGAELVGHIDLKADRSARRLVVQGKRVRRGFAIAAARRDLARWLGLR